MFGFSAEHLLILAGILLIFGPKKLPELGASVGKAMKNFKEGLNGPTSSGSITGPGPTADQAKHSEPSESAKTPKSNA